MRIHRRRGVGALATIASVALLVTACGGDDGDGESSGKTSITVEGWRPGDEQGTIDAVKTQAKAFMKEHPDIVVEPVEWEWSAETFATQLAGGTLPTTFRVPFTDTKGLAERGQIADVTEYVEDLPYSAEFNPSVLAAAKGTDDKIYGLPTDVYGVGLHYNRALFEEAGLDPDSPPTTWDEVRADAKAIADSTGQAGYVQMTSNNTGGWMLTTLTYALGGRMQSEDGTESTVDNDATAAGLQMLHDMRWVDESMGKNTNFEWGTINEAFAAGKIGMYMSGSDVYNA
ncbi:MAG: extracellular solute-binding protein, partial [Nocardioides sp.]